MNNLQKETFLSNWEENCVLILGFIFKIIFNSLQKKLFFKNVHIHCKNRQNI